VGGLGRPGALAALVAPYRSVSWTGPARLAEGASFDQQLSLGFPVGATTEHVTLAVVEPGQRAGWAGDSSGIRSCHLWSFTPLPGGGTQVGNVEAFTGLPIALVRPLAARRWNRDFQGAVDGLIRQVTQTDGAAAN
jgi:hypothetical protein